MLTWVILVCFRLQGQVQGSIFSDTLKLVSGQDAFKAGQEVSSHALPRPSCSAPPILLCPAHLARQTYPRDAFVLHDMHVKCSMIRLVLTLA